ncbi:PREDICTED: transcription factor bHLH67-like isoform X2 [Tarenaya hassleriana]|uniref:transcription factor bHLH67-like isoform X2 n=1 Tax=Tarenaya hassleriana TaxID=28532 RepID=UPI00053C5AE8|nr:PREDICTED: transcription factor bHLH67-like isoform X2 [Tarenaya hassleriana]
MEKLQGHINPSSLHRQVDVGSLEVHGFAEAQSFGLEDEEERKVQQISAPGLQETIPLLQMLQNGEPSPFLSFKEPNFLALLSLQTLKKPWELENNTHEVPDFHSSIHSETSSFHQNPASVSCMEEFHPAISNQELPFNPLENLLSSANTLPSSSSPCTGNWRSKRKNSHLPPSMSRERRKRKRTKPTKNIEDIENQRMTHIAVERNRRRQMNDHLNSLRILIPPSYVQRGDQASIIGGAIDFVKALEQLLLSLEAQKRTQKNGGEGETMDANLASNHVRGISSNEWCMSNEDQASSPKIEATVIQNHVNLKVQCPKKQEKRNPSFKIITEWIRSFGRWKRTASWGRPTRYRRRCIRFSTKSTAQN